MDSPLLSILGAVLVLAGIVGLIRGKVVAGGRGLRSHHYTRDENPVAFHGFVIAYVAIGAFVLIHSL